MLPVYCSNRTAAFLMETEPWRQLRENKNILLKVFGNLLREEVIGNFSVVPVLVPHRSELSDTLAFRFRPHPPQGAVDGKEGTFYCPDTDGWGNHLLSGTDKPGMSSVSDLELIKWPLSSKSTGK